MTLCDIYCLSVPGRRARSLVLLFIFKHVPFDLKDQIPMCAHLKGSKELPNGVMFMISTFYAEADVHAAILDVAVFGCKLGNLVLLRRSIPIAL